GRIQHGLDDVVVAGAAADIALELVAYRRLVELAAIAMYDVDRGHDHARSAEAALQAMIVAERRLHRMQLVALGNAFDGRDAGSCGLSRKHGAGFDRPAIDMHDTGAALAGIAADIGAGQVQMIAQELDKKRAVLDIDRDRLAVHREFDCRHVTLPKIFYLFQLETSGRELCNWEIFRARSWKGHGMWEASLGSLP